LHILALDRTILRFTKRGDAARLLVLAQISLQYSGQRQSAGTVYFNINLYFHF